MNEIIDLTNIFDVVDLTTFDQRSKLVSGETLKIDLTSFGETLAPVPNDEFINLCEDEDECVVVEIREEEVQKILCKRLVANREKEYLVMDMLNSSREWKKTAEIAPKLIDDFEAKSLEKWKLKMSSNSNSLQKHDAKPKPDQARPTRKKTHEDSKNPFKYGLIPDYIYHVKKTEQGLIYFVKWKNGSVSKLPSSLVREKCPEVVLKFLEEIPFEVKKK